MKCENPACNNEFSPNPFNPRQRFCCENCRRIIYERNRTEKNRANRPTEKVHSEYGSVYWHHCKGCWVAETRKFHGKKARFYGTTPEIVMEKRREWLRANGFLTLAKEVEKLCQIFGTNLDEFYEKLAVFKGDKK